MMALKRCFKGWWKSLIRNRYLSRSAEENNLLQSMFRKWCTWIRYKKYKRRQLSGNMKKLDRKMVNRMFLAYTDVVKDRKCVRGLVTRQLRKSDRRLLNRCFQGWISFMQV